MLELCTQTTNDTVLTMLRILRNPFMHRVVTIELSKRQVVKARAVKNVSEAGEASTATPAESGTAEVKDEKSGEEEAEGKMETATKTEPAESEVDAEENEDKEGEVKVKEEKQTSSPAKPATTANASRQPVWNEVKETG